MVAQLRGRMVAQLRGRMVAQLRGRMVAQLRGRMVAQLRGTGSLARAELLSHEERQLERLHVVEPRVAQGLVACGEGGLVDLL